MEPIWETYMDKFHMGAIWHCYWGYHLANSQSIYNKEVALGYRKGNLTIVRASDSILHSCSLCVIQNLLCC